MLQEKIDHAGLYARALMKWLLVAGAIGILCGIMGSLFHIGVEKATQLRQAHDWLLWCLPLAGVVIVALYQLTKTEGKNTNDILDTVHLGSSLPLMLLPAIFGGTILTHLCGASAGREGAALQMGGDIGFHVAAFLHMDDKDMRLATLCGMSAFFSALFGTPLTATIFALEVVSVGVFYYAGFVPAITSALVAYGISFWAGIAPTRFEIVVPALTVTLFVRVVLLAILCAFVSILLCETLHRTENLLGKIAPNPYARAALGGALILILTLLIGNRDYNGAGMDIITASMSGYAEPLAFLIKLLFTAITIGAGFKGGEVVPTFFVGATFGCMMGALLGIPAGFAAAIGLVAVFCGAVNCPLASIILSVELFGSEGLLLFAVACGIGYMLSGYRGLYSSQTILYSKLKAEFINVHTRG